MTASRSGKSRRWTARAMASTARGSLDLLFPPGCAYCDVDLAEMQDEVQLCQRCRADFLNLRGAVCVKCGCELPASFREDQPSCANCRDQKFQFAAVIALAAYRGDVRKAILQMKFSGAHQLTAALTRLFASERKSRLDAFRPDAVIPVPMHWTRRIWRGTNSAETVAEYLARALDVAFAPNLLARQRKTQRQADLPPGNRFANIRGALSVTAGYDLQGLRILLVDDVLTTGATCSEAARTLLAGGASQVSVAVIARALPWK